MCQICNQKELTPDQLDALQRAPKDVQNFGMLLRHLRNGMSAIATTIKPVRNDFTHAVIPVGTKVMLTMPPSGRDTYHSGGVFHGNVVGSKLSQSFYGDWLDMFSIEYEPANKACTRQGVGGALSSNDPGVTPCG